MKTHLTILLLLLLVWVVPSKTVAQYSSYVASPNYKSKPSNWGFGTGFMAQAAFNTGNLGKAVSSHQTYTFPFAYYDIWYKHFIIQWDLDFGAAKVKSININGDDFEGMFRTKANVIAMSFGYEVYDDRKVSIVPNIGILSNTYSVYSEDVIRNNYLSTALKEYNVSRFSLGFFIDYKIIKILAKSYLSARLKYNAGVIQVSDKDQIAGSTHLISIGVMITIK